MQEKTIPSLLVELQFFSENIGLESELILGFFQDVVPDLQLKSLGSVAFLDTLGPKELRLGDYAYYGLELC